MRLLILFFFLSALLACHEKGTPPITKYEDYAEALNVLACSDYLTAEINKLNGQIHFWERKISENPGGFIFHEKLGAAYVSMFDITGRPQYIHLSNAHLKKATAYTSGEYLSKIMLALGSNSIKLHQFDKSRDYSIGAYSEAKEKFGPLMMIHDAEMELGNFGSAGSILEKNANYDNYDFLVRYAKYLDHQGELPEAIVQMEKALQLVVNKNQDLYIWTLSTLGDMYGHQGLLTKSYQTYLRVLDVDPTNEHALKGIAWIAYSNDGNTKEARYIMETIANIGGLPDPYLLLAEMCETQGNYEDAEKFLNKFIKIAEGPMYKDLYASYLAKIYMDQMDWSQALEIVESEVKERPTPASWDLLAWFKYKSGEIDEAEKIVKEQILNKSFEPQLMYHSGIVMVEAGNVRMGIKLLNEALEASFELGPEITAEIKKRLLQI